MVKVQSMLWAMVIAVVLGGTLRAEAAKWRVMEGCTLIEHPANDGDSFHVRWKRRHYIFRLYFVDAPETDLSFPDRVAEQAAYFGVDVPTVLQLGKQAAKFTANFLADGFTIYTLREDARGRSERERFYALVRNAQGQDLGEALVANGLARIHGVETDIPDGPQSATILRRLKGLEQQAKSQRVGGWSPQLSRRDARLASLMPTDIVGRTVPVAQTTTLYDEAEGTRPLGFIPRGTQVKILEVTGPLMVKVELVTSSGQRVVGQCRRTDLGL